MSNHKQFQSDDICSDFNGRYQNEYRYLLVDPLKSVTFLNDLCLSNLKEIYGAENVTPVLRPDLRYSLESCPHLILLAAPGEVCSTAVINEVVRYGTYERKYNKRYICGLLSSACGLQVLSQKIADNCRTLGDQITTGYSLPFFEPLRMELLYLTQLSPVIEEVLWPISTWWYIAYTGKLNGLNSIEATTAGKLTWGMQEGQLNIRDIWRILYAWDNGKTILPDNAVYLAAQAWKEVGKIGLHQLRDKTYLALNALNFPVDITRHSTIASLLQQARENPSLLLTQLLQTLPDSVWLELEQQSTVQ